MSNGIAPPKTDSLPPSEPQGDSTSDSIGITVVGRPRPAGSKRSYNGHVVADNPYVENWMQEVRSAAAKVCGKAPLIETPVELSAVFEFARPKCHYGSGRNAGTLKASAPVEMAHTPDLCKLIRAVEDALTKTVWKDDAQIVQYGKMRKQWSLDGREQAVLIVRRLENVTNS